MIGRVGLLVWNTETWEPTTRAAAPNGPTEVEVGYTLGRDYWGQGFATEAAGAVRDYAPRRARCRPPDRADHPRQHGLRRTWRASSGSSTSANIMLGRREAQLFALDR